MNRHEQLLVWAQTFLFAFVQLGLMLMAPAAQAITKANFDKVTTSFQWETASTVVSGLACDDCAQQINIGFDFPFAGGRFDKVYVSSNGLISLLDRVNAYYNTNLPTSGATATTSALIMPYWDDLNPAAGGSITYATLGSAPNRRLVVSWNDVPHYPNSGQYNIQAILYETGEIKFQYGSGNVNGSSATIGIEVANDDFIKHSYNQGVIHANSALLFRPQPYVQSVTQPCGSLNILIVQYSYPMDAGSAGRKQNYDFVSSPTPGLNVASASLSPDGYTVTLALNKSLQAGNSYQLQIKDALSRAGRAINPNPTIRPISGSSGLIGTYYSQYGIQQAYHTGPWVQRNDAQINFSWDTATPDILPRGDDFSIRWEGYLIPSSTGSYVFRTYSDDGIRLWVNGTKILDAWNLHAPRYDDSSAITLNAGEAVPIVLEHFERGGRAFARLYWDEPDGTSGNYALIPSSALSPCPLTPTGPDHIRIEHDGQGLTCQAERITLKACADASCSSLYTGSVTVDLTSPASGWSPDPVTFSGGSATVNLSVATASKVTLAATATSPVATSVTRCFNGATETCEVGFSACAGDFNCLEAREPVSGTDLRAGRLYTKLAGTAFGFDVAALKSDGTRETNYVVSGGSPRKVTVELVDASSGGACSALPRLDPSVVQEVPFTNADAGRKAIMPVTVNRAWRNVKCRVTDATVSPSKVACSTDAFAIRPTAFASVTTSVATADTASGATATPRLKAGGTHFDLSATAIAGYDGTPTIDNALIDAHAGAVRPGEVAGGFGAAVSSTGVASGSGFTYSEVGYFRFKPNGVYDDGFTSIDTSGGDCTDDFSNTLDVTTKKYGCKFANRAETEWFGRFVPDHFTLVRSSITPACSSGFSYMDQPFTVEYQIEARNAGGTKTENYHGNFAKATVIRVAENNNNGVDLATRTPISITEPQWMNGTLNFYDDDFKFIRETMPDGPFDALTIGVSLNDNDGEKSKLESMDMNAATSGSCTSTGNCNAKALSGSPTIVRFGRLYAERKHQFLETHPISLSLMAQYWDGSTFETNPLDNCTTLSTAQLKLDNNEEHDQDDGSILVGGSTVSLSGAGTLSLGVLNLNLTAPGLGHSGFVDITPQLNSMPMSMSWLRFDWNGDGKHDENPRGRASWGMYRGNPNVIYMRERWN
jgi:hypothetical protein